MVSHGGRIQKVRRSPRSRKLLAAGAIGVACQKLGEAEVMAAAGIRDILVANQIVGDQKIIRLVNLLRHADVVVAVDDRGNVAALDAAARAKGVRLRVVIKVDIGGNRAGVMWAIEIGELSRCPNQRTWSATDSPSPLIARLTSASV
jgi:D-serine deaminase-like pyridoxal phosphate-dependent protein